VPTTYYYLVASLPGLVFSAPAALSRTDFVTECARHLTPEDQTELEALLAGHYDHVRSTFSRDWLNSERQMRNAVVRARALRLGVDEKKFVKDHEGFRLAAEAAVNDAFSRANPLERELALDRFRWNLADELNAGDPFGFAAILAYAVKLAINEHWRALTPERGRERFEEMVGVVGVSSQEVAGWSGLSQM
jgi:hypothetical protein